MAEAGGDEQRPARLVFAGDRQFVEAAGEDQRRDPGAEREHHRGEGGRTGAQPLQRIGES